MVLIFRYGKGSYEKPISWILHGLATWCWCMAGLVGAGSVRRPPPVRPQPCCSYTSPPPDTGHVIIVCSRDFNIWFNGTWNFVDRITWQLAAKRPTGHVNLKWQSDIFLQVVILPPNPITFKVKNIYFENFENVLQALCYVIIMHHSLDNGHGQLATMKWPVQTATSFDDKVLLVADFTNANSL